MKIIYEPRGAAREYAPLAANLYRGCGHACRYCYAPACLRMDRALFVAPEPRKGVLEALTREAPRFAGDRRPVLLCFTCDPYQPIEREHGITRRAIEILNGHNIPIRLLTKNPRLAIDLDAKLLVKASVDFGVTMVFTLEADRKSWEPKAAPIDERVEAIRAAKDLGLRTWVSLEPVIDPGQSLLIIRQLADVVDVFKVGKLNHNPQLERMIDWTSFLRKALEFLTYRRCRYYIKEDLWRYADEDILQSFPRTKLAWTNQQTEVN